MRCVRARILAQRCEEGAGENVRVFARRREVLDVVGDLDVGCLNVVGDLVLRGRTPPGRLGRKLSVRGAKAEPN